MRRIEPVDLSETELNCQIGRFTLLHTEPQCNFHRVKMYSVHIGSKVIDYIKQFCKQHPIFSEYVISSKRTYTLVHKNGIFNASFYSQNNKPISKILGLNFCSGDLFSGNVK